MRVFSHLTTILFGAAILMACSEPCERSYPVCKVWESPDNLVMRGYWAGTYDVGWHHLLFDNEIMMTWDETSYNLRIERDGLWREPIFRTYSFFGSGPLSPQQNRFFADYSATERWILQGSFSIAGRDMLFEGDISSHDEKIGTFSLRRPVLCVQTGTRTEYVCKDEVPLPEPGARLPSAIAAGRRHTCAQFGNTLYCWGDNSYGQLGNGGTRSSLTPTAVKLGRARPARVVAGRLHSCMLSTEGAVLCWGYNAEGELGDGSTIDRHVPTSVVGLSAGMSGLTAGGVHTCAWAPAGTLRCWGDNSRGQIGDGTTSPRATPVDVSGLGWPVVAATAGRYHTCALANSGEVACWGDNAYGQLGDGTFDARTRPVLVPKLAGAKALAAGDAFTCALLSAGEVQCWGQNFFDPLTAATAFTQPTNVMALPSLAVALTAGALHICAVTQGGEIRCVGDNTYGQLGAPGGASVAPGAVPGISAGASIEAGDTHSCAIARDDKIYCWGDNAWGQLGDGSTQSRPNPVAITLGAAK